MTIVTGLWDGMVLQRNARNVSESEITGTTVAKTGTLHVAVNGRALGRPVAVRGGKFALTLRGLKTGGPYRVTLQLRDGRQVLETLEVNDVLVGDVWLAAGQSNMEGAAFARRAPKPVDKVRAFYLDDRWAVAREPIHNMHQSVDEAQRKGNEKFDPTYGVGPAVMFAQEMHRLEKVPQGIIPCARGATSLQQWAPAKEGGATLYGAMIRRLRKNGNKVAGMIWYQGESDAINGTARLHTRAMKRFVHALRRDVRLPRLPIAMVQIAWNVFPDLQVPAAWNQVQEQQRLMHKHIDHLAVVPAIDVPLDNPIHVGGVAVEKLGSRLAYAIRQLRRNDRAARSLQKPMEIRSVRIEPDETKLYSNVVITVDHAVGRLHASGGRPTGFTLTRNGEPFPLVYDVELLGNRIVVKTPLDTKKLKGHAIHYGFGCAPYCNIVDEADRSIPVFGPWKL